MTLSTALILGLPRAEEQVAGEQQAAELRGIFHGLALAVLETVDGMEEPCPE